MADTVYRIKADTRSAQQSVQEFDNSVKTLNNTFGTLTRLLGGLAIGRFVQQALSAANAITDLNATTQVSVQNIAALSQAFQENSGSAQGALISIQRLSTVVGEARDGNQQYIRSFERLGISLRDLRRQSPDEILENTVKALGNVENAADRAAIATRLLGRSAAAVDFATVGAEFDSFVASNLQYSVAAQDAGRANQQLRNTVSALQRELTILIGPITKFIAELDPSILESTAKSFLNLGKALAIIGVAFGVAKLALGPFIKVTESLLKVTKGTIQIKTVLLKVLALIRQVIPNVVDGIRTLIGSFSAIFGTVGKGLPWITRLVSSFTFLLGAISMLAKPVAIVVSAFAVFNEIIRFATGRSVLQRLSEMLSIVTQKFADLTRNVLESETALGKATRASVNFVERIVDSVKQLGIFNRKSKEVVETAEQLGNRLQRTFGDDVIRQIQSVDQFIQNIDLKSLRRELEIISNLDPIDRPLERQLSAAAMDYASVVRELNQQIIDIEDAGGAGTEQWQQLVQQVDRVNTAYQEQIQLIRQIDAARRSEAEALRETQAAQISADRQYEARLSLFEDLARITADGENAIRSLQNEMSALTMGSLERELLSIQEQQQEVTERANAMAYALYEAGAIDYSEYLAQLKQILELESQITADRQQAATELFEQQRLFSTGWKQAFTEYAEAATDSAQHARDAFSTFTSGIEDAFVQFAKTGKLSFRSLVDDMLAQIVRLTAQRAIMSVLGAAAGGPLGALFGGFFADGGRPPVGKVSVVGEKGPELFVPSTAGTIIPNNQLQGGGAPVTNNYITNNISAIDSKSVAQLFAENRKTLLGTVQMAQRELP